MEYFSLGFLIILSIYSASYDIDMDKFIQRHISYGAAGDRKTDNSQAFSKAREDACKDTKGQVSTTIAIPSRDYLVNPVNFVGPCNSPKIMTEAYSHPTCYRILQGVTILKMSVFKLMNGQRNHISMNNRHNVSVSQINTSALDDSPHTDGNHVANSGNIQIQGSVIGAGISCGGEQCEVQRAERNIQRRRLHANFTCTNAKGTICQARTPKDDTTTKNLYLLWYNMLADNAPNASSFLRSCSV